MTLNVSSVTKVVLMVTLGCTSLNAWTYLSQSKPLFGRSFWTDVLKSTSIATLVTSPVLFESESFGIRVSHYHRFQEEKPLPQPLAAVVAFSRHAPQTAKLSLFAILAGCVYLFWMAPPLPDAPTSRNLALYIFFLVGTLANESWYIESMANGGSIHDENNQQRFGQFMSDVLAEQNHNFLRQEQQEKEYFAAKLAGKKMGHEIKEVKTVIHRIFHLPHSSPSRVEITFHVHSGYNCVPDKGSAFQRRDRSIWREAIGFFVWLLQGKLISTQDTVLDSELHTMISAEAKVSAKEFSESIQVDQEEKEAVLTKRFIRQSAFLKNEPLRTRAVTTTVRPKKGCYVYQTSFVAIMANGTIIEGWGDGHFFSSTAIDPEEQK